MTWKYLVPATTGTVDSKSNLPGAEAGNVDSDNNPPKKLNDERKIVPPAIKLNNCVIEEDEESREQEQTQEGEGCDFVPVYYKVC